MKIASQTNVGLVRASNQDSLLIQEGKHGLFGVADGMGGHKSGDVASRMAVLMLATPLCRVILKILSIPKLLYSELE